MAGFSFFGCGFFGFSRFGIGASLYQALHNALGFIQSLSLGMSGMADFQTRYDQVTQAIGEVCLWWTALEDVTLGLCLNLAVYIDLSYERKTAWNTLNIVLLGMDIRGKIATAKALAHHVDNPHSADFYDRLEALLNFLDNTLRGERNRYVHDTWHFDENAIVRAKHAPVVRRTQSRSRELFLHSDREFKDVEEVRRFIQVLELAYDDLATLEAHIAWLIGQKEKPSESRQPLPAEWRSFAHREWLTQDTRPRPPQSSQA